MLRFDPRLDILRSNSRFGGVVERAVSAGPYQHTSRLNSKREVHNGAGGVLLQ